MFLGNNDRVAKSPLPKLEIEFAKGIAESRDDLELSRDRREMEDHQRL